MLYVHVPFCRSFCTYCDFYSEIACKGRDENAINDYVRSACAEIQARGAEIESTAAVNTLYIGGGTPSVLPLSCFREIVSNVRSVLPAAWPGFDEFTVEVNPDDVVDKGPEFMRGLAGLGVNRVSMGVQSLDDAVLKWMNRRHDAKSALAAVDIIRSSGIDNLSLDVIFGLGSVPGASPDHFSQTLDGLLHLRPQHVSAYQLSIEEGSALARMAEDGRYQEASDEECRQQYDLICERLQAAGYVHYEISNWALPGFEARHNSSYWTREPYVGIGPGAHSFAVAGNGRQTRSWNTEELRFWARSTENLTAEDVRIERVMLGLRTAAGMPEGILRSLCGDEEIESALSAGSLVRTDRACIRIPESRFFVSDDIIRQLI